MDKILTLPAPVRHFILLMVSAVLTVVGAEIIPDLQERSTVAGAVVAAALTAILAVVTPLVSAYGVGAPRARQLGARSPGN